MKLPRLVAVTWRDSQGGGGWQHVEAMRAAVTVNLIVRSVGFLLELTSTVVRLAAHMTQDGEQAHSAMDIPRVAVVSIRRLQWPGT